MKKMVVGIVIGALLMFSGQALADGISLVGKKVGSEAKVILNGTEISNAVIINSKSYAPVRDISEAFGGNVEFEPGVITIETSDAIENIKAKLKVLEGEKRYIIKKITDAQESIDGLTSEDGIIARYENLLATEFPNNEVGRADREEKLAFYKAALEEHKATLAEWQAKLDQINAEIAELEAQL